MKKIFILVFALSLTFISYAQTKTAETATPAPVAPVAPVAPKVAVSNGIPKNPFELGVSAGLHTIWGDVNSNVKANFDNSTFGLHIRKAFTHAFSMRLQYNYATATMKDNLPHYTAVTNRLTTNPAQALWFPATQSYSHTLSLDNIVTIGNNSLYKASPKWLLEFFAGPSLTAYRTRADYTNANGVVHNFSGAEAVFNQFITNGSGEQKAKNEAGKFMDNVLDGNYETLVSSDDIGGYSLVAGIGFGTGVTRAITDKLSLGIEQRFNYLFDDYIDGERFANFSTAPQFSQMNDIMSNTTIKANYILGKKGQKPLYWRNPQEEINKKLASINPKKALNEALMDDDGDGVPNILDQEPGSREGCNVDTKGIMMDSDKDGLIDCDDKEPYSPAGFPVDNNGVAKVPPPACCEGMEKKVSAPQPPKEVSGACAESSLPSVQFDKNKYGVNSSMIPSLKTVGDKMQVCPDMKLVVNGINDKNTTNGKLNEQLSYNRAMEVTNYLSEKFGISRDRFIVRYNLEGVGEPEADRAVMFRSAQDGESGIGNPPSPHPGLRAGTK